MTIYDFQRYLNSKKTVDDRALNLQVWTQLQDRIYNAPNLLRIVEVGCGTGTMVERALERGLFERGSYLGIDALEENIVTARTRLPEIAQCLGWSYQTQGQSVALSRGPNKLQIAFETADVLEWIRLPDNHSAYDVLIASAFLDLVNVDRILPKLFKLLKPGGYFYFALNFDGVTIFEPVSDLIFDSQVMNLYHRSMDERVINGLPSGDSQSGRHLFHQIPASGGRILAAGPSDWVVFPAAGGAYLADEAYFLQHILSFFEETLSGYPELDAQQFQAWLAERHGQVIKGELVYIAHQIDFFGMVI